VGDDDMGGYSDDSDGQQHASVKERDELWGGARG
jgi:hypothetical protein